VVRSPWDGRLYAMKTISKAAIRRAGSVSFQAFYRRDAMRRSHALTADPLERLDGRRHRAAPAPLLRAGGASAITRRRSIFPSRIIVRRFAWRTLRPLSGPTCGLSVDQCAAPRHRPRDLRVAVGPHGTRRGRAVSLCLAAPVKRRSRGGRLNGSKDNERGGGAVVGCADDLRNWMGARAGLCASVRARVQVSSSRSRNAH
jgi:hypothetical protein